MISYNNKEILFKGCPGCAYGNHKFELDCGMAYENHKFELDCGMAYENERFTLSQKIMETGIIV